MKILSFTLPHGIPNLYEFLSYVEHKTMEVNGDQQLFGFL